MNYVAHIVVILGFLLLQGCEALQQPVSCNSDLDCPSNQVCLASECLPKAFAECGDEDSDGVCDDYDICAQGDDSSDLDSDGNPDECDPCPFDYPNDSDGDGVCESSDVCAGGDDNADADADGVADACDVCEGFPDGADVDGDGIPDGCDRCPQSTSGDSDSDGVCDDEDVCPGFDDTIDTDSDGVPDSCDLCPDEFTNDSDGDGVCNGSDICAGFPDSEDADSDGIPDGCDECPQDAAGDSDGDTVCDSDDKCPGQDDLIGGDSDGDTVPDLCDTCSSGSDLLDSDDDGYPDACDKCPFDPWNDSDLDDVCDSVDICLNGDDNLDTDGDGLPNACDACPLDSPDDLDGDGNCDSDDICFGDDATGDSDNDGTCNSDDDDDDNDNCLDINDPAPTVFSADGDGDGSGLDCDACVGQNSTGDTDSDGTCNDQDGDDDNDGCADGDDSAPLVFSLDSDSDGDANDCDICPLANPNDSDNDGICENEDVCAGQDSSGDTDNDGTCNNLDLDDDNDGCPDSIDAASQLASSDTDGDGIAEDCDDCLGDDLSGDNDNDDFCNDVDDDDDNDGCNDDEDLNPLTASSDTDGDGISEDCDLCVGQDDTGDSDNDGTCNNLDNDDDNDNCVDALDPNPLIFQGDSDNDGTPDDCDNGFTVFAEDFETGATAWTTTSSQNDEPMVWAASNERTYNGSTSWRLSYPANSAEDLMQSGTAQFQRSAVTLPAVNSNQKLTLVYRQFFDFDREDTSTCFPTSNNIPANTNGDGGVVTLTSVGNQEILSPARGYSEQLVDIFSVTGNGNICQDHPDTSMFGSRSKGFANGSFDLVTLDVSAYAGQSIQVGLKGIWDCGNCFWSTDEDAEGWYIDDMELVRTTCGNNVVELGEACDDGNTQNGDGCSSDCKKRPVLPWLGSDSGTLVSDKLCPSGSLGVGFAAGYNGNQLEDACLICRAVGDSGLGATIYAATTGNQCQIANEVRCDVEVDGTALDSVAVSATVWFNDNQRVAGLALGCQSLAAVGTDWGTHSEVGGPKPGATSSLQDQCDSDQALGGFSASLDGSALTGFQFTCTGACSEDDEADECGVCGGSGAPTWYQDVDGDGLGVSGTTLTACTQPGGYAAVDGDPQPNCTTNDEDVCGVCAGPGLLTWYRDIDSDGLGDPADSTMACTASLGYVSNSSDPEPNCVSNDTDVCGVCGGAGLLTWYRDLDSDGLGDVGDTTAACTEPLGYVSNSSDSEPNCASNDTDACGVCAGSGPTTWYADADGDGAGDSGSTTAACSQPTGYVANDSDPCPADNPDDIDGDGICNSDDPDQDGDGCADVFDPAPTVAAAAYDYETHIEPVLTNAPYSCTGCHSSDASWSGYINLSIGSGYDELMGGGSQDNSVCAGTSYSERVSPGNPADSFFYRKVAGTHDCGDQMPQGCSDGVDCVSDDDLALIYMWICQGALEN
ncbi:MAG: hypothetical protein HOK28_15085 [Deltaproteobacteria bacterium]|nr:hypothetical protein [Deltaproteobacteria bacterium]